ncbi:MAG: rhomboid family intramembrane serine protease [Microthrixaceae bacterium]
MDSFRPRFGASDDPWFRVGTFDVGSSAFAGLLVLAGMVLWAVEGPSNAVSRWLWFDSSKVLDGEVWRLLTWFIPEAPSLWVVVSAVIVYYFGSQMEGAIGRARMAQFLAVLVLIPSLVAVVLDLAFVDTTIAFTGSSVVSLSGAVFYAFVAYMPRARFFFGIPAWVLAAVFVAVEILSLVGQRDGVFLLLVVLRVALTLVATRAFGLAEELQWIPKVPIGSLATPSTSGGGGRGRRRKPKRAPRSDARLSVVENDSFETLEIDAILDQVSALGVDSLTSDQKKRLKAYSKDRKKKR